MMATRFAARSLVQVLLVLVTACSAPPSQTPAPVPTTTEPPPPSATATHTAAPPPTSTATAAPTPLPGAQVYPISSLASGIPWLDQDTSRIPFSAYYAFNFENSPFDNKLVRQAFAAAVDKELVAEQALGFKMREAVPAMTLTPPAVLARDLYGAVGIPFDPANARALLTKAGYASGEDFPHTTLLVYMRSSAAPGIHARIAASVADMWKENLGVEVEVRVLENFSAVREQMHGNQGDMYVVGWGADYIDPDNFLNALFQSGSEMNLGHFSSPAFDGLVNQAARNSDPEHRQQLYIQAEQIISESDVAVIPLFHSLGYLP